MALEALPVLLFTLVLIVFIFSGSIYWLEPRDNIESFPRAVWFTVVTMSTVGYGDTVPRTPAGYAVVSVLMIISALYMAMPIGIVGSAFNRVWEDRDRLLLLHRMRTHLDENGYDARDIPELFFLFDENKDGNLSYPEFRQMMTGLQMGLSDERLVQLFHAFDHNGTGSVDDVEFVRRLFPQAFCQIYGPAPQRDSNSSSTSSQGGVPRRRRGVTSVTAFRPMTSTQAEPRTTTHSSEERASTPATDEQSEAARVAL